MSARLAELLKQQPLGMTINIAAAELKTAPSRLSYICEIMEGLTLINWDKNTHIIYWRRINHIEPFMQRSSSKERTILQQLVNVLHKEEKLLEEWICYMQASLRQFAARPELRDLQYIMANDIQRLKYFHGDTLVALHAPVGTTCEIPHPEDALEEPHCRYQIFVRHRVSKFGHSQSQSQPSRESIRDLDGGKPQFWHLHPPKPSLASISHDIDGDDTKTDKDKDQDIAAASTPAERKKWQCATHLTKKTLPPQFHDIIGPPAISPFVGTGRDFWAMYYDTPSRKFYYHNRNTDAVQWDEPFEVKSSRCVTCGYCAARVARKKIEKHREKCDHGETPPGVVEKKRKRSDKNGPPKPINAFLMFCRKNRRKLMNEAGNQGKAPSQISKILGQRWCLLTEEFKKEYREMSRKENLQRKHQWELKIRAELEAKESKKNKKSKKVGSK